MSLWKVNLGSTEWLAPARGSQRGVPKMGHLYLDSEEPQPDKWDFLKDLLPGLPGVVCGGRSDADRGGELQASGFSNRAVLVASDHHRSGTDFLAKNYGYSTNSWHLLKSGPCFSRVCFSGKPG